MPDWRPSCTVEVLRERGAMLAAVRDFFAAREVLEVQTPALGRHTVTDPALDSIATLDGRHLQTSPEYHMKRLLAAGAPSIYQIAPAFRDGEAGRSHNPEFTMLEWYRVGFDASALMGEVAALVDVLLGEATYEHLAWADLLGERFGVDVDDQEALSALGDRFGLSQPTLDDVLDLALAEALGALAGRRVFVTGFPAALAALARIGADGRAETLRVDRRRRGGRQRLPRVDRCGRASPAHGGRRRTSSGAGQSRGRAGYAPPGRPAPRPTRVRGRGDGLRPAPDAEARHFEHRGSHGVRLGPGLDRPDRHPNLHDGTGVDFRREIDRPRREQDDCRGTK